MRALDFVRTPGGGIGLITETSSGTASIAFLNGCNPQHERNAWWSASDLKVIDSLPHLLACELAHPFGNGKRDATRHFATGFAEEA